MKNSTTSLPTRIQVGHKYIPDEYCSLPFVADGWGDSGIYFMPRAANNQLVFGSVARVPHRHAPLVDGVEPPVTTSNASRHSWT